jgi:tRNA (guanine10-N2)-methyltransferase
LKQYELEDKFVDILVADFSTKYLKNNFKFDAIITDPPYGIREKTKKIGNKKNKRNKLKINHNLNENNNENNTKIKNSSSASSDLEESDDELDKSNNETSKLTDFHPPQHTNYMLGEIFHDLLDFSAEHLNENGRLTFWVPIFLDIERDKHTYALFLELIK